MPDFEITFSVFARTKIWVEAKDLEEAEKKGMEMITANDFDLSDIRIEDIEEG